MSSSKLQRLNTWFGWRDRTGYRIRSEGLSTYALVTGWKVEVRGRSRGNSSRRSRKHKAQDQALVVLQLCSLWSQHQTLIHPSIHLSPPHSTPFIHPLSHHVTAPEGLPLPFLSRAHLQVCVCEDGRSLMKADCILIKFIICWELILKGNLSSLVLKESWITHLL